MSQFNAYQLHTLLAIALYMASTQLWAHDVGDYPPNDQRNVGCEFTEYSYYGFVKGITDGDTIDVDVDLGQSIWHKNQRLRFYDVKSEQGVNAPESRTKDLEEKALGLAAKRWLHALIYEKWVVVTTYKDKTGSFKRYLSTVCRDGHDIIKQMLDIGMVSVREY